MSGIFFVSSVGVWWISQGRESRSIDIVSSGNGRRPAVFGEGSPARKFR